MKNRNMYRSCTSAKDCNTAGSMQINMNWLSVQLYNMRYFQFNVKYGVTSDLAMSYFLKEVRVQCLTFGSHMRHLSYVLFPCETRYGSQSNITDILPVQKLSAVHEDEST